VSEEKSVFPTCSPEEVMFAWRFMVRVAMQELPENPKAAEAQEVLNAHNAIAKLLNDLNLKTSQNIAVVDMLMMQMVKDYQDQVNDAMVNVLMKHALRGNPQ
jgi:hypothetical protein